MIEKILSELKSRVGKTNLSDKTISDHIAGILPFITDEAQLTEQFYTIQVGAIKSMDGNFSRDVAAQVEEAKKNLVPPQTPPVTPPVIPPVVVPFENPNDAILAKLNEISERQNKIEQADALKAKQTQRNQHIENIRKIALTKDAANEKSGWASNAGVLETAIRLIQIEDADTMETIEQKCQQEYNGLYKNHFGTSGAIPGVGDGGNGGDSKVDAIANKWLESKGIKTN